eukprot:TRINITY_DN82813_c0_g1_i1.p1 TRINITY_DN82813_c0_g1~~TRINITY_DN82813_c0_g1_i1.p1  ORF type:complete len:724 (-),score=181.17 TRINITY_DN82813_c0_g1_i1:260-2431(-)
MVYYLVVEGVDDCERPRATSSSGVHERCRYAVAPAENSSCAAAEGPEASAGPGSNGYAARDATGPPPPPSPSSAAAARGYPAPRPIIDGCECVCDELSVRGIRLFRSTGGGLGARSAGEAAGISGGGGLRRLGGGFEDALPMQRTSALLLLAVPSQVSLADLRAFLGASAAETEALRLLQRSGRNGTGQQSAAFYSVVILCRTQASADALYKANHGRLFRLATSTLPSVGHALPSAATGGLKSPQPQPLRCRLNSNAAPSTGPMSPSASPSPSPEEGFSPLVPVPKPPRWADLEEEEDDGGEGGLLLGLGQSAANNSTTLSATTAGAGSWCCYLVFLEVVVYVTLVTELLPPAEDSESPTAFRLSQDVPTAAYELPACPLCLERLDVSGTGMVTHNQGWLSTLAYPPASCCRACAAISAAFAGGRARGDGAETAADHSPLLAPAPLAVCETCLKQEEIWVCLICGHLGCGRYAAGHAKDHALAEKHRFCFQLATGRIWDYHGDVFVHRRLVQMAAAGGLFEVALPAPAEETEASSPDRGPKPHMQPGPESDLAMELDAILASQLDHQRSLYEEQLLEQAERQAQALARGRSLLEEEEAARERIQREIAEAEKRRHGLERQLAGAKKSCSQAEEQLGFVKDLNAALLKNRREMASSSQGSAGHKGPAPDEEGDAMLQRLRGRVARLMEEVSASAEATSLAGGGGDGKNAAAPAGSGQLRGSKKK